MKRLSAAVSLVIMALTILVPFSLWGERPDSLRVSLITCYPGPIVYELEGHEAIRIRTADSDSVWNYGMFDFAEPGFIYRFVKGEPDYVLGAYPFRYFLPAYMERGSKVIEQDLDLTPQEARQLLKLLQEKALPQNRKYRYNYVYDNCATRVVSNLDSVASSRIIYPDSVAFGTFRKAMRHYHKNYPWYQFGIDFALGSGIDRPINAKAEMFAPVRMADIVRGAHFEDGRSLVADERVLYEGTDVVLPPTPWYLTPLFWAWLLLAATVAIVVIDLRRGKLLKPWYCFWFFVTGLAGCVVVYLVGISSHEATSPNLLIWWLNPGGLLLAVLMWIKKARIAEVALMVLNAMSVGVLILVWPFQTQTANPSFFPLMGISLALSVGYAVVAGRNAAAAREVAAVPVKRIKRSPATRKRK